MITRLRARNFKAWKDTKPLRLAPLTGLFGTNSSGKTSILQLLLMLKQTVESPDRKRVLHTGDPRTLVDLGTYFDLIHGHDAEATLHFSLEWRIPGGITVENPEANAELFEADSLGFRASVSQSGEAPVVDSFEFSAGLRRFGMKRLRQDTVKEGERGSDTGNARPKRTPYDLTSEGFKPRRAPGRQWPLPPPVKCYGFPDEAFGYYQNTSFLSDLVLSFEQLFSRVAYLGPLRRFPQRSYIWAGERPVDVGRDGELAVPALLAANADRLRVPRGRGTARRYAGVEERVAEWLQRMELIHSFSLRSVAQHRKEYEVRVRRDALSPEVLITDVGFGVSQILPVLVLCYYVPDGSTILLEQPEIHLHPSVQSWLADVFIDVVNERDVQLIVESHSEHLLRRLQRRIAEEEIETSRTSLYFCSSRAGGARIEELEVDKYGNIENWPAGFFGDEVGDLAAMAAAEARRKKPS